LNKAERIGTKFPGFLRDESRGFFHLEPMNKEGASFAFISFLS